MGNEYECCLQTECMAENCIKRFVPTLYLQGNAITNAFFGDIIFLGMRVTLKSEFTSDSILECSNYDDWYWFLQIAPNFTPKGLSINDE